MAETDGIFGRTYDINDITDDGRNVRKGVMTGRQHDTLEDGVESQYTKVQPRLNSSQLSISESKHSSGSLFPLKNIENPVDPTLMPYYFNTKLNNIDDQLQFDRLVDFTFDFLGRRDSKERIDIDSIRPNNAQINGYLISGVEYTTFSMEFFYAKYAYENKIAINFRFNTQNSSTNTSTELAKRFERSLPSEFIDQRSTGLKRNRIDYGVKKLWEEPEHLQMWLYQIQNNPEKRRGAILQIAKALTDDKNLSLVAAQDKDYSVTRLLSEELRKYKQPSLCRAVIMALVARHRIPGSQDVRPITDQQTLRDVVYCFLKLLHAWNNKQFDKVYSRRYNQNLIADLLLLILLSNVPGGVGAKWSFQNPKMKERFSFRGSPTVRNPKSSVTSMFRYQNTASATTPSTSIYDEQIAVDYQSLFGDDSPGNALHEYLDHLKSCEYIKNDLKENWKFWSETDYSKKIFEIFQKLDTTPASPDPIKKQAERPELDIEIGKPYIVSKDSQLKKDHARYAGLEVTVQSLVSDTEATVAPSGAPASTVSIPRSLLRDLPAHHAPKDLRMAILTAYPTMIDNAIACLQNDEYGNMSQVLNKMGQGIADVLQDTNGPYQTRIFCGPLTAASLKNEQAHIIHLQGLSHEYGGMIFEDEADYGGVADMEDLRKGEFGLFSCRLMVLSMKGAKEIAKVFHKEHKVPHILYLADDRKFDDEATAFLKEFYHALLNEAATIQEAYDFAVKELNAKIFALWPESDNANVRLVDLLVTGINSAKDAGWKPWHWGERKHVKCNSSGATNKIFTDAGNLIPAPLIGPIPSEAAHRVCERTMDHQVVICEWRDKVTGKDLNLDLKVDAQKVVFESDIVLGAQNIVYRLLRSQWNEHSHNARHKFRDGILNINLVEKEAQSPDEIIPTLFEEYQKILRSSKRYKVGQGETEPDTSEMARWMISRMAPNKREKKICIVFTLDSVEWVLKNQELIDFVKAFTESQKQVHFIFVFKNQDGHAPYKTLLKSLSVDENEEDAIVSFDLEDKQHLDSYLQ